ncbi:MAG: Fic family protein [Candidatus Gracilibacteria bacterium]
MDKVLKKITAQQKKLESFRPLSPELVKNLEQWFKIELTYTSNAIEGNTLSRQETALVVEKGITIGGKSMNEHLEAINHAQALEYIKKFVQKKRRNISERDILDIHHIILSKIDDTNAGRYRSVSVRIAGSTVVMPNPLKVPELMSEFTKWLHGKIDDHPVKIAADAHFKFVSIHPFTDGNGRTARLLMNLLLLQEGYPPALIKKEDRLKYINAIEKGQLSQGMNDYYRIIYESVENSLNIYLKAVEQKEPAQKGKSHSQKQKLLKIGELAGASEENVPTIRYWTQEGLLKVAEYSPGGYQLYAETMIEQAKKIRQLQKEKRLTIREIKEGFSSQ